MLSFLQKMNKAHEVQDSICRSNTNHYLATFCINHLVSSVFFVIVVMFIMYLRKKLLYNLYAITSSRKQGLMHPNTTGILQGYDISNE